MENLDHEGFYIPNQEAFSFFMSVYQHVCQVGFVFLQFFNCANCDVLVYINLWSPDLSCAGALSPPCHLWVCLEEYRGSAILS